MSVKLPNGIGRVFVSKSPQDKNYEVVVELENGDVVDSLEFYDTKVDALNAIYRFAHYCELAHREGYKLQLGTRRFGHCLGREISMWEFLAAESDAEFITLVRTRTK